MNKRAIFVVVFAAILGGVGCSQKQKKSQIVGAENEIKPSKVFVNADIYKSVPFIDHSSSAPPYLAMNIFFEPLADLRKYIELREKVTLKHRGEAHITVVSPPEYEQLKSAVTIKLLNEVALLNRIQETPFEIICLGKGEKIENGKKLSTYFVVIEAPELFRLRHSIESLRKTNAGNLPSEFRPQEYFPHVTIGFTERDLHLEDGVVKNKATCFSDIQIKAQ